MRFFFLMKFEIPNVFGIYIFQKIASFCHLIYDS